MNKQCRYWTFNGKQLQSVVSKFCKHYCTCYCLYRSSSIDMRKIVCSFTSDTALNDVLVHALVWRIRKWKRISNVQTFLLLHTHTDTHTHTHTHTTNVTIVRSVRRCVSTSAEMTGVVDVRVPFTAFHASLNRQQIREWFVQAQCHSLNHNHNHKRYLLTLKKWPAANNMYIKTMDQRHEWKMGFEIFFESDCVCEFM